MRDLLICITAHKEGHGLRPALQFAEEMCLSRHFQIDGLVTLDKADPKTVAVASDSAITAKTLDYGDVGAVRNWCLDQYCSEYRFILFLDGDDWCTNGWVLQTLESETPGPDPDVYVPNTRVLVWGRHLWALKFRQPQVSGNSRLIRRLTRVTNMWGSCVLIPSRTAKLLRYRLESEGFLFEDWWYHMDIESLGGSHISVPGKYFYRQDYLPRRVSRQNALRREGGFLSPRPIDSLTHKLKALIVLLLFFRGLAVGWKSAKGLQF